MKMCVNWKVVAALALVGVALFALAPGALGAALPVLVIAACPLSMLLMMRAMHRGSGGNGGSQGARDHGADRGRPAAAFEHLGAEDDRPRAERAQNS